MLYLPILVLLTLAFNNGCNKIQTVQLGESVVAKSNQTADPNANLPLKELGSKIESRIEVRIIDSNNLEVSYLLRNNSTETYLLFNRGDIDNGYLKGTVYVEPQTDGTVEISQKLFRSPSDADCPDRMVAFFQGASVFKPGQTVTEKFRVPLPLVNNNLRRSCSSSPPMPLKIEKVRFGLGLLKANPPINVKKGFLTVIGNPVNLQNQELLESSNIELK